MEVCSLSRGVLFASRLNPYPPHYKVAFASSILLCPQPYRLTLQLAFPKGELRVYHVSPMYRSMV